jgi:proline iminopeptidase
MPSELSCSTLRGWERYVPPEVAAAWQQQQLRLGDGTFTRAVTGGTGPTLVLVPPIVGWKEALWPQAVGLASRFRTVVYDLRERAAGGVGWEEHLSDLERVTQRLAPPRFALLGHSLGGALALQYAVRHPERVAALVLSSTHARVRLDPEVWWSRLAVQGVALAANRWLPEAWALRVARALTRRGLWVYDRHCDEDLLRFVRAGVRSARPAAARARVALARSFDAAPLLAQVRCPTLVVVGGDESRWARESAEELAHGIRGAELRVVPEANHLLHLSRAALYNQIVGDWLGRWLPGGEA